MLVTNPFSPGSWTREQIDSVSRRWWVLLLTGIISVVAGGVILGVDWSLDDLAVFVGALLVFRGIFTMFSAPVAAHFRVGRSDWASWRRSSGSRCGCGPARPCSSSRS